MGHVLAEDLRAAVLQAAITGKLTEQLTEDGDAKTLLNEIIAKKSWLIKNGTLAKQRNTKPISSDEAPYDIPDNWLWVRWGELSNSLQYGANLAASETGNAKLVRISDIQNNAIIWETVPFTNASENDLQYLLAENDILFARTGGTVGKSVVVKNIPKDGIPYIFAGYLIRSNYNPSLSFRYLKLFMESELYWNQLRSGTTKSAQPNCNGKTLSKMMLPLPPIAEQKRIVARVEELMAKIDEYEKLEKQLVEFKAQFPGDMKAALLQAAMEGKLTEQLPGDGDVNIPSTLAEYQGDLSFAPAKWKWCAIDDVLNIQTGLSFKKQDQKDNETGDLRVLRGGNISDNMKYTLLDNDIYVELDAFKDKYIQLVKDDIIMPSVTSMQKMCKTAFIDKDLEKTTAGGFVYIIRVKNKENMDARFAQYFLGTPFHKEACRPNIHKSGQAFYNLKKSGLIKQPICVPPLAEQKRIVEKLDQLLPLCDELAELSE